MGTITIQIDNTIYTGFNQVSIEIDKQNLCGTFKIAATTLQGGTFPIKRMQKIIVFVEGFKVMTGYVDSVEIEYDSTPKHNITIDGRDITMDLADSSIDSSTELKSPVGLVDVINHAMADIGLTGIKVINEAGNIDPFTADELVTGMIAQNAFDFIDMYSIKRQVLVTTNEDGNIVLTQGTGIPTDASLINEINGTVNNVKEARVSYNDSKRYNKYIVRSQANHAALSLADIEAPPAAASVEIKGQFVDDTVRVGRTLSINADKSSNVADTIDRAKWESQIRNLRAIDYYAIVAGFRHFIDGGDIWRPFQLVRVVDDFCGLNDNYIIKKLKFDLWGADEGGSRTTLYLAPADAFKILSEQERRKRKTKKKGKGAKYATESEINDVINYGM